MNEQQIKTEVIRYIDDDSYNYAILIDGAWGTGKTYFVKNTLSSVIQKHEAKKSSKRIVKYISLYGCKSLFDIQENVAWTFADNAREKISKRMRWGASADTTSANIVNSSKKIGNIILKKYMPEGAVYKIAADWLDFGSYVFIFDDLERCDCSINEVFGFLNELVEHGNAKVIIVANEQEIIGTTSPQYIEQQYSIALESRIKWPRKNDTYGITCSNKDESIDLNELERRRKILFPEQESNSNYKRIREKLIGVTLKYEPDVPYVISEIIRKYRCDNEIKEVLIAEEKTFCSIMEEYEHNNFRTFQFFLSKAIVLLEQLSNILYDEKYHKRLLKCIITETFEQAVLFKSNYKPRTDSTPWSEAKQECSAQSIREYVRTGNYSSVAFTEDVMKIQAELRADVPRNDPYYLLYRDYYWNTQSWCEENLEKLIENLKENIYPLSFYEKIIISVQRLLDLGFDATYMIRVKNEMIRNVSNMGEVNEIGTDLWYIDDADFKERLRLVFDEINNTICKCSSAASKKNVKEILKNDNWVELLETYTNPNGERFIQDKVVFSKATAQDWIDALNKSVPQTIDDFRHWLIVLYPSNVMRRSYSKDADIIKEIIVFLEESKPDDLIKKANFRWLHNQFEDIVRLHNPDNVTEKIEAPE